MHGFVFQQVIATTGVPTALVVHLPISKRTFRVSNRRDKGIYILIISNYLYMYKIVFRNKLTLKLSETNYSKCDITMESTFIVLKFENSITNSMDFCYFTRFCGQKNYRGVYSSEVA